MGMPMGPIVYSLCFILEIQKSRRTRTHLKHDLKHLPRTSEHEHLSRRTSTSRRSVR